MLSARKDMPYTPGIKMKQLQWDKLPHQQVSKTLWSDEDSQKEQDMLKKLQNDGVWSEMEEDFKAKQLMINLLGGWTFLGLQSQDYLGAKPLCLTYLNSSTETS